MDRVYQKGLSIFLVLLIMVLGGMSGVIAPSGGTAHAAGGFAGGKGTASDPYQIATADQLNEVRNYMGGGIYFELTADIDLSSYANWEPIGTYAINNYFYGNIDGNGFKITNLKIDRPGQHYIGLFGANKGIITNIILEVIEVKADQFVGGLVGFNDSGTISNSYTAGSVSGFSTVGGLVGYNGSGTISNSYAIGSVSGSGILNFTLGGLVGVSEGTISNCYATGSVSGYDGLGGLVGLNYNGSINTSYATGNVSGTTKIGGLVGHQYAGASTDSFYDSDTTKQMDTGKGTSKTTSEMQDPSTYSGWDFTKEWYMITGQYPKLWAFVALTPGTIVGTTKLRGVATGMEYKVNAGSYTSIVGTSVDNIVVGVGDQIYVRVKGSAQPASAEQTRSVSAQDMKIVTIQSAAIDGVTVPVTGATPAAAITDTPEYTASIAWNPSDATFAGAASYTATVTITPKSGYTLTGVPANFFTVVGATTTNTADSGVVTAVFPATAAVPIKAAAIAGVTVPVAGEAPVAVLEDTAEYTAAIAWTPSDATFAGAASYTATISLTAKPGYTLAGVAKDFFKVAGAITTNEADSGVVTAVFPATAAVPVATAAIAGVTIPVAGEAPTTSIADTAEYTAVIAWTPADTKFAGQTIYEATITLTPKPGYTLAGVTKDFFKVVGATTTNEADSGVVTAVFPATAAVPITTAAIAGVALPVAGEAPVAVLADTAEYTAAIDWTPADVKFAGAAIYTAKISLTPKPGYTLAGVAKDFFKVAGATTTNAADSGIVTAVFPATAASPISTATIAGVVLPVAGGTPVATVPETAEYTASIDWTPANATFAGGTSYTATITLTPKPGYTLNGVPEYFFSVPGAITTNTADSGVVIAKFPATAIIPATAVPITAAGIEGVMLPVTGATPVTTATYSPEYTATVSWSPAATVFAPGTAYTATITVTPRPGYTLTGVPANFFTVAGASTTNTADSGVVTAEFPITATLPDTDPPVTAIPITAARVAGVTVPVTGAIPVTTATYSPEYTATVSWSPATTVFAPGTAYTATITITPKSGYTLSGVPAYFFSVPGASTTNTANSGVVTAEFPATAPVITDTGSGNIVTPSSNNIITSTNGKITLPVNQAGEVSFEDGVKISIPAGAAAKELIVSIEKVLEPQKLFPNKEIMLSPVYEITKNFAEDFSKPVTMKIAFDPALVTSNQQASVFYYDEVKKAWIEAAGGKIEGNHIIVEVDHFGKYAVLSVDKVTGLPVRAPATDNSTEIDLRDVAGHWAAASIQQALNMGMVKGYLDGTFRPNHSVTRAEFAVMLINVLKPQGAGARLTFTDTATIGAWAQTAIAQAVQAGIITGYEDGGFRPNAEITRAEMAVILAKALGVTTEVKTATGFTDDKDIPAWAKSSVDFVKEAGIVQGKGENAFAPQASATRAEAVTVLLKLLAQQKK
ncbi:S-layer homology domain-containing protein [Paenibacillus sp. 22594]